MLFLALLCTSFAFIGMNWAVKHTSASRASLLLGTEPVWSTILATVIGGELMGPAGVLGALLIIGATYWGQAIESRHRNK
jgi:drug/metabolite transporter (DMT)-like permease